MNMFKKHKDAAISRGDTQTQTAALSIRRRLSRPLAFSVAILFNLVGLKLNFVYFVLNQSCAKCASYLRTKHPQVVYEVHFGETRV